MVADELSGAFGSWLDDDEVDARRQSGHLTTIGESAVPDEPRDGASQAKLLAPVERFLGDTEVAAGTPPNLDDDELAGWARVDGDQIQLVASNTQLPGEDDPACPNESIRNELLR